MWKIISSKCPPCLVWHSPNHFTKFAVSFLQTCNSVVMITCWISSLSSGIVGMLGFYKSLEMKVTCVRLHDLGDQLWSLLCKISCPWISAVTTQWFCVLCAKWCHPPGRTYYHKNRSPRLPTETTKMLLWSHNNINHWQLLHFHTHFRSTVQ